MRNPKPLVSIILPVHNCEKHLVSCLDSLFKQTYKNLEIIAIDDKSCDSSLKILRSLKRKDNRLKVYANIKRYGISLTLNRAVKRAKGQFITFMDADDLALSNKISHQVKFLTENSQFAAIGAQCFFVNELGKKIGKSSFPNKNKEIYSSPLHGISMQFETVLINRRLLPKDVLKFKTSHAPFIFSDLLIKILPYGKFANLEEALHYHRKHPEEYILDLKKNISSLLKLWIKSITFYNYNPTIRSFFAPLIRSTDVS